MEKRTKIIVSVAVLTVTGAIGIALGLHFSGSSSIELEVLPRSGDNSKQPLIRFRTNDADSWSTWKNQIEDLFKEYRENIADTVVMACSYDHLNTLRGQQVCDFPVNYFDMCTGSSSICVFFRLNKILNWTPVPFNNTEEGLPANMPENLQYYIKTIQNRREANTVWLDCEGDTPADKEYIGPLQYVPTRGFPTYYFPYTNQKGFRSPLVAVMFERPKSGVLINVVCSAWARNIKNDETEQQGVAHFSFMVD